MSFDYSPYATLLFLAAAVSGAFAVYSLRRRQQPEALTFGLMMLALSWWSLCYGLHICGTNLETQYFFNSIKYLGVVTVPPLWLVLALQYTEKEHLLTRRNIMLIFLPAVMGLFIVLTNRWTGLWWPEVWLGEFDGQAVFRRTHGFFYYLFLAFSYLYIVLGLLLYVRFYQLTASIYRFQSMLMVIAAAIPLIASVLTQVGFSPLPWGLDPFFFALSSTLIAVAIFRYRFLDIIPIARRIVVEQVPEGVIVIDASDRIVDTNLAARRMFDSKGIPIIGQSLAEAVPITKLRQALLEIIQAGSSSLKRRDVHLSGRGGNRVLSLEATPLIRKGKDPIGQIIILHDISERVAAQQELEDLYKQTVVERERLTLTISTTGDAVVLLNAKGEVLADNPAARQILQAEQLDEFPPALQVVLTQAQATSEMTETKVEIGMQSFHVVVTPIAGAGLVLTMHDVTHFEQLARLKDEFVATVSHDLRAPLTSIIGYAQMAQQDTAPEEKRVKALKQIEKSAWRMSDLVSEMLDLATLEAGLDLNMAVFQVDELARIAAEDLEGAALAKGLAFRFELDQPAPLRADPQRILQVWRNLIDNALKYTETGTITLRVESTNSQVVGQVIDTGIGIPPTEVPYIFDKFFRAKRIDILDSQGAGLGLALVKTVVERHRGRVWVESVAGVGSTFTFILPRIEDDQ